VRLDAAADYLAGFRFEPDDRAYLATLRASEDDGAGRLFPDAFLDTSPPSTPRARRRHGGRGRGGVRRRAAGARVRPGARGPARRDGAAHHVGFPTLVATKAARVCEAAGADEVLEFGLRRAQGPDGGLTASRAAYVGGCAATSNLLAGRRFGVPVRGTHAHSWVLAFDSEPEAFAAYADALPNNCVFLVDTYDTLEGVRNAARAGEVLRARGHRLLGVRLDSGDLAYLSGEARRLLDEAGFPDARILASNDLDERLVASLKAQGAPIAVWGVGTRLVTAYDQPALGCVYKLTAMRDAAADGGRWRPRVKVSEQARRRRRRACSRCTATATPAAAWSAT
jgi:nicotinate phosphoribosyltransferase